MIKKIINYILILTAILFLYGCISNENNKDNQVSPYISYVVTKQEDHELNMYVYSYDCANEKTINRAKIKYESQYPLAVYSNHDEAIYFSQSDLNGNDQLHRLNLTNLESECLTDTLFAINYIIPLKNKVYIAAVEKGTRAVGLFEYKDNKLTRLLPDKDAFVWKINYNPKLNVLVFNTYSQEELDRNMENNNSDITIGSNSIWTLNVEDNKMVHHVETEPGYITSVSINNNTDIFYLQNNCYKVENNITEITNEFDGLFVKDFVFVDEDILYYLDYSGDLLKYDMKKNNFDYLYTIEEEYSYLNNAIVLN